MAHLIEPNWMRTENTTLTDEEIEAGLLSVNYGLLEHLSPNGFSAIIWTSVGICALMLAGRLWVRITRSHQLRWDDYWMIAAWCSLLINAILQQLQMPDIVNLIINSKRAEWYAYNMVGMTPEGQMELFVRGTRFMKYEFTIIGFFWTTLWCVKASFLAFFYTLFEGLPNFRRAWWCIVVFTFLTYVSCWVASANNCHPPKNYFIFGACNKPIDTRATMITIIFSTCCDILIDLMIMAMPLMLLWKVQINTRQKLGLAGVFSLGTVIIIFSIIRAVQVTTTARNDTFLLAFWGVLEITVAVIVGCLPPFKALLSRGGSSRGTGTGGYYNETNGLGYNGYGVGSRKNGTIPLQSHATIRGGKDQWQDADYKDRGSSRESLTGESKADAGMWAMQRIHVKKDVTITSGERPADLP